MTYANHQILSLVSHMTDMSEDLISESDIRAGASMPSKTTRRGRFATFMNHPAMVAVLCAVVSISVLVAVVMAGRQGPVTPPVGGTLYGEEISLTEESEASTLRQNISLEDFYASDVYVSYSPGYSLLHCEMIPERYVFQSANIGEEMPEVERVGFVGSEEQIVGLPKVEDPFELLRFHVSETRRNLFVFIHDADMNVIHRASLDVAEPVLTDKLAAGVYYVSLHSEWENDETYGADEFVFALSLSKEIDSLKIDMVWKEETKDTLPSGSQESSRDILDAYAHVFHVGQSQEELLANAETNGIQTLTWAGYTYIYVEDDAFLLARNDASGYVFEIKPYVHRKPTKENVEKLQVAMRLEEATEILGAPIGIVDNWGCISLRYLVEEEGYLIQYAAKAEGEVYYGRWPTEDIFITVDSFPESDNHERIYSSPEKTQPLLDFFDGLALSPVPDGENPDELAGHTYVVGIYKINGDVEAYVVFGSYVRHNRSDWMKIAHEDTMKLYAYIDATPTDAANVSE